MALVLYRFNGSGLRRTTTAKRARALPEFLLLVLADHSRRSGCQLYCICRKGHFGGRAIRRNSNILCLLLSHLHLAREVSPSEVSNEITALQY